MEREGALKLIDDVSLLLQQLQNEKDPELIKRRLAEIVVYIRTEHDFRGDLKGKQTESIAMLETNVINFLDSYHADNFEEIYSIIREIIRLTPKFFVFGIDIAELRDIAHDFDDAYRYHDAFKSIASDIRRLTHQNLSDRVILKIEKLEEFLRSDKSSDIIDGSVIVGATEEDKEELLESEVFQELLQLKNKLKIAWTNKDDNREKLISQQELSSVIELILVKLASEEVKLMPAYTSFMNFLEEALGKLKYFNWEEIPMGKIRYYLKKLIEDVMSCPVKNKGEILFRLLTVDTLLEQIAFIAYSNVVNSELREINDENYIVSLHLLVNLALCSRAVGHGTKHLGRFAMLIDQLLDEIQRRPDRAAHFPSIIDVMNTELENNFTYLQEIYWAVIHDEDKLSLLNKVLNNLIREKTTHLLANLINNIKTYLEKKERDRFQQVLDRLREKKKFSIKDYIFSFGTDVPVVGADLECPEFMGGKGCSQVRNSRIIIENKLKNIEVPRGEGFSTLAWHFIKDDEARLQAIKKELVRIVADLEKRTGKKFGDPAKPLLLMARSGATVSMPGVLSTIGHIGITFDIAQGWSKKLKEPGRAFQAYLSFMLSYASTVLGLHANNIINMVGFPRYEALFLQSTDKLRRAAENLLDAIQLESYLGRHAIPDDPHEQLYNSVIAIFRSFENSVVQKQAKAYVMPEEFQTACLIQECMPILSSKDCSGVLFTRNPITGSLGGAYEEQIEFSEGFFGNVIADGIVSPSSTDEFVKKYPKQYRVLKRFKFFDEREQRHPTDIEFAIRGGKTYIVQSRILKQSPIAVIVNSYNFYKENIYSPFKLIKRTAFGLSKKIVKTYLDQKETDNAPIIARGKPVYGGAVRGRIIIDDAKINTYDGQLIFITESNVPPAVIVKEARFTGYISKEGGLTSHAALVAIGERKPCVTDVQWERGEEEGEIILGGTHLREGDFITLDANTGNIYQAEIPIISLPVVDKEIRKVKEEIIGVIDSLISTANGN